MIHHKHINETAMGPVELRRLAQNQRLISENQRGEVADALDWAAGELERLVRAIAMSWQLVEEDVCKRRLNPRGK